MINMLDFHFLGDWESFTREWCYGYGNNIVRQARSAGRAPAREGLMLRRAEGAMCSVNCRPSAAWCRRSTADDEVYRELMRAGDGRR